MKKKSFSWNLMVLACLGVFVACSSDDDPEPGPNGNGDDNTAETWKYVVAASGADAKYLMGTRMKSATLEALTLFTLKMEKLTFRLYSPAQQRA